MLDIVAGLNQRDIYVAWCLWFRLQNTVDIPQLQFFVGRRFSCRGAEADSHGVTVQQTTVISQLQFINKVRHLLFRGAEAYLHNQAVQQTIEIPLLQCTRWSVDVPV